MIQLPPLDDPRWDRITISDQEIDKVVKMYENKIGLKKIAATLGYSVYKVQANMLALGITKEQKRAENRKVAISIMVCKKHYAAARKEFMKIIEEKYSIGHDVLT